MTQIRQSNPQDSNTSAHEGPRRAFGWVKLLQKETAELEQEAEKLVEEIKELSGESTEWIV